MAARARLDSSLVADLWVFRITASSPSFTVAAERLAVSQSAVSQRIQRLEGRLGVRLFVRADRQNQLTYPGQLLFDAAQEGFDGIQDVVRRLDATSAQQAIRVSCVPSLALEWLMPRLSGFLALRPDLGVAVFAETHDLDRVRMHSETIDVAIRYGPDRDRGTPRDATPPTPPGIRVRTTAVRPS
jgi:DNA-binding transcriptional LysR family regulator